MRLLAPPMIPKTSFPSWPSTVQRISEIYIHVCASFSRIMDFPDLETPFVKQARQNVMNSPYIPLGTGMPGTSPYFISTRGKSSAALTLCCKSPSPEPHMMPICGWRSVSGSRFLMFAAASLAAV